MTLFTQSVANGLTIGSIYVLLAIGFSLLYSTGKVLNFAHGEIYMLGSFTAYYVVDGFGGSRPYLPVVLVLVLAAVASCFVGAVLGLVTERLVFRPLRNSPSMIGVMSSLGLAIVLTNLALRFFGADPYQFPRFWPSRGFVFSGAHVTYTQLGIVMGTLVLALSLDLLLRLHPYGRITRAVAGDTPTARLMGISVEAVLAWAFVVASILGALAGFVVAFYYGRLDFNVGFGAAINGFSAAVIGGFGNLRGAVVGGMVLGLCDAFAGAYISRWQALIPMLALLLAVVIRPAGLLGSSARQW